VTLDLVNVLVLVFHADQPLAERRGGPHERVVREVVAGVEQHRLAAAHVVGEADHRGIARGRVAQQRIGRHDVESHAATSDQQDRQAPHGLHANTMGFRAGRDRGGPSARFPQGWPHAR
jgi:hypothetical protein